MGSLQPPAYHRLKCPSLAVYPVADSAAAYFQWYHTLDSAGRRDASDYFRVLAPGLKEDIEQYRRAAPRSHVAEIHDASHWGLPVEPRGDLERRARVPGDGGTLAGAIVTSADVAPY